MSTKTSIKRIALVAAAALTLGGFSVITASSANAAAAATATFNVTAGHVSTGVASIADTATATSDGAHYVTIVLAAKTADQGYNVTTSGAGSLYGTVTTAGGTSGMDTLTVNYTNGANAAGGFLFTSTASPGAKAFTGSNATATFTALASAAGTQTITATPINGTSAASTLTITWSAAATMSVGTSTYYLNNATNSAGLNSSGVDTATAALTNDVISVSKTTGTVAGSIVVYVKDNTSAAYNGATVSASITGSGLIAIDTATTATAGTTRSASLALDGTGATGHSTGGAATNMARIHISADGTSGTGTITVSLTDAAGVTTVLGTRTVTFVGSIATVKAVQHLYVLKAGGTTAGVGAGLGVSTGSSTDDSLATTVATTSAVVGYGLDSNGNGATGTVKIVSSDSTVITAGTCTAVTVSTTVAAGTYNCAVTGAAGAASGKSATITFEATDALGNYTILATPLTFTIGGAVASVSLTTDAATYNALSPVVFNLTAKDSAGNTAYDQDGAFLTSVKSSVAMGGTLAISGTAAGSLETTTAMINGKATYKGFFAPLAAGTLTITALDALSVAGEAVSASASINGLGGGDSALALDAANAATDAANNAYDEAQNATQAAQDALAAVTALAKQVSSLIASVKSLTALVSKIKAKVGA